MVNQRLEVKCVAIVVNNLDSHINRQNGVNIFVLVGEKIFRGSGEEAFVKFKYICRVILCKFDFFL
jgi:hypothetical protein